MLQVHYSKQFKKDIKKIKKSGNKDFEKLKAIINTLIVEEQLSPSYNDHKLQGDYKDHRECHIQPDWLLTYKIDVKEKTIIFERTGSHADLFE
ncbi:MAG: type II toxin-antitoxin system YafQ family toxin [Nitrospira sp.]|nr:type II toxin-antitoxin system YafQ family toxin [Nitrospira sp.]